MSNQKPVDNLIAQCNRVRDLALMHDIMVDVRYFYRGTPSPTITYMPLNLAQLGSGGFVTYNRTLKLHEKYMCDSVRRALNVWHYTTNTDK